MTAGETPPRSRLVRDIVAVFLLAIGIPAVLWAAAATDWRVLMAVLGCAAIIAGAALGRGE